jgi:hypothetical protein
MGSIGFPKMQQAEDVEYDHEQDAEQDRNQHDRGRKSWVKGPALASVSQAAGGGDCRPSMAIRGHPGARVVIARAWPDS